MAPDAVLLGPATVPVVAQLLKAEPEAPDRTSPPRRWRGQSPAQVVCRTGRAACQETAGTHQTGWLLTLRSVVRGLWLGLYVKQMLQ